LLGSPFTPRRLAEHQTQALSAQPGNLEVCFVETGGQQQGVVGSFLEPNRNVLLRNHHRGAGVNKITEQVARFGFFITVANAAPCTTIAG
jgi:hypothetical protein